LQDAAKVFRALLVTHMKKKVPQFWNSFMTRIMGLYGKDFVKTTSDREDYHFLSIHYHWYSRYAESVSSILFVIVWLKDALIHRARMPLKAFTQTIFERKGSLGPISLNGLHTSQRTLLKTLRSLHC